MTSQMILFVAPLSLNLFKDIGGIDVLQLSLYKFKLNTKMADKPETLPDHVLTKLRLFDENLVASLEERLK